MGDSQPRRLEERLISEIVAICAVVALTLVQMTLLITPWGFPPPLLLVVVISRALVAVGSAFPDAGIFAALRWACYGGLTLDLFSGLPLGCHIFALVLAIGLVSIATRSLQIEGLLIPLLAMLAGSLIYEISLALIANFVGSEIGWRNYATIVIVPSVLLALVPPPPIFALMRRAFTNA